MASAPVLVVEEDAIQRHALMRALAGRELRCVETGEEAICVLRSEASVSAAIINIGSLGADGLELLLRVRAQRPALPVVVLSARVDPECVNTASRLSAWILCEPTRDDDLRGVIDRLAVEAVAPSSVISRPPSIAVLIKEYGLSRRESEVLEMSLQGLRRDVIRERLGICESAVKKIVTRLLRKCGAESLRQLGLRIAARAPLEARRA
jgi:DNA-binding NarL/FixJ family response regulator